MYFTRNAQRHCHPESVGRQTKDPNLNREEIFLHLRRIRTTKCIKKEEGSLMIESIVAMSLVVIGILGIVSLLARSANISHSTTHSLQATYLAAEGVEIIKNVLDTDIAEHYPWGTSVKDGTYCVYYDTQTLTPCSSSGGIVYDPTSGFYIAPLYLQPSFFTRMVQVTSSGGAFSVSSTVQWYDGGAEKSVMIQDIFQDWRS